MSKEPTAVSDHESLCPFDHEHCEAPGCECPCHDAIAQEVAEAATLGREMARAMTPEERRAFLDGISYSFLRGALRTGDPLKMATMLHLAAVATDLAAEAEEEATDDPLR
jgi:hypothetical protein